MAAMSIRPGNATEKANLGSSFIPDFGAFLWTQRHFGGIAKAPEVSFVGVLVAAFGMALGGAAVPHWLMILAPGSRKRGWLPGKDCC